MTTKTLVHEMKTRLDVIADDPDLIYGVEAIAKVLNLKPRKAHYHLSMKRIPAARKLGGVWVASRRELLRPFVSYPAAAE